MAEAAQPVETSASSSPPKKHSKPRHATGHHHHQGKGNRKSSDGESQLEPSRVVLDVGGVKYFTTLSTLTKENSMLSVLFSGQYSLSRLPDGSVFIDRDGNQFKYILTYLRDGVIDEAVQTAAERGALLREARYYQLVGLIELLTDSGAALRLDPSSPPLCRSLELRPPQREAPNAAAAAAANGAGDAAAQIPVTLRAKFNIMICQYPFVFGGCSDGSIVCYGARAFYRFVLTIWFA